MQARLYKPPKSAMQSGRANTKDWVLEFEPEYKRTRDPLMGWTGSVDMPQQVKMHFENEAEARAYCRRMGIDVQVQQPQERKIRPKSYAANFQWQKVR